MDHNHRILVATDLGDTTSGALRAGAALALGSHAELAVVHVVPSLETISMLFPQRYAAEVVSTGDQLQRADAAIREHVARVGCEVSEVFIDEGTPYAEIVKRAESWRADIIVVGSHGRSGLARVFGSVAQRVVRHADCAVLVARGARARTQLHAGDRAAVRRRAGDDPGG